MISSSTILPFWPKNLPWAIFWRSLVTAEQNFIHYKKFVSSLTIGQISGIWANILTNYLATVEEMSTLDEMSKVIRQNVTTEA